MTPHELADALAVLGWSVRHLARELECSQTIPQRWLSGRAPIPRSVEKWLRTLATAHLRHPAPRDWRTLSAA